MIHKGLSVKVCGVIIEIERNDETKTAKVIVSRIPSLPIELEAVKAQASLLRDRAQRFLGRDWTVEAWAGTSGSTGVGTGAA